MRSGLRAILTCCIMALAATTAQAGKVTRLQIELPPNVRAFEPGQRVDTVQVVGIDADGRRVGFDGATPVLTATAGKVEIVDAPYRFAYTAPPRIDGPLRLTLEARLPGSSSAIKGSLQIEVLPPGPYVLLRVEAPATHVDWNGSLELEVRGETRDGRVVPVADRRIEVVVDGPGTIEFTRLGHYRYRAPKAPGKDGGTTAVARARFVDDAAVHGELTIALGSPFAERKPPRADDPAPPAEEPPTRGSKPPELPPAKPPQGRPPAPKDAPARPVEVEVEVEVEGEDGPGDAAPQDAPTPEAGPRRSPKTVLWSGGRLRLTAWRVSEADASEDATRRITKFPEPGGKFAAREPVQRLRFLVEDETVLDVTADARHGSADGERAVNAVEVKMKRNKAGKLTVVVEARPKADGTELHVTLSLSRAQGDPSTEELVLKRRKAKEAAE